MSTKELLGPLIIERVLHVLPKRLQRCTAQLDRLLRRGATYTDDINKDRPPCIVMRALLHHLDGIGFIHGGLALPPQGNEQRHRRRRHFTPRKQLMHLLAELRPLELPMPTSRLRTSGLSLNTPLNSLLSQEL